MKKLVFPAKTSDQVSTLKATPIRGIAQFESANQIAADVLEMKFKMLEPRELNFKAGQYIALVIEPNVRRQYSISSAPAFSRTDFELLIDTKPNGVGVNFLKGLKRFDKINFVGQIGLFVLAEELKKNLYFISTGTGIAPLKSMIEELILSGESKNHNIYVIFGTRFETDIFYRQLFENYKEKGLIKDYQLYLSRSPETKNVNHGYVTRYLESLSSVILSESQFFICGGGDMINSTEMLLLEKGVSPNNIYYEKFY